MSPTYIPLANPRWAPYGLTAWFPNGLPCWAQLVCLLGSSETAISSQQNFRTAPLYAYYWF